MPTIDDRFKMRRGTAADLAAVNEVPLKGEWIWEEDQGLDDGKFKLKIGDGVTHYNDLEYLASGGGIESVVPGSGIDVDDTDPKNPVVSSTLGSIALDGTVDTYAELPTGLGPGGDGAAYFNFDDELVYIWNGAAFPDEGEGVSAATGGKPRAGSSHKWWRIYITEVDHTGGTSDKYVGILELQMRAVPLRGGSITYAGITVFADSSFSSAYPAVNAFNGNITAVPNGDVWASSDTDPPHFLGCRFFLATDINEITVWSRNVIAGAANMNAPKTFIVQSSDDSTNGADGTWVDEWTIENQTGWGKAEARTFTRPGF